MTVSKEGLTLTKEGINLKIPLPNFQLLWDKIKITHIILFSAILRFFVMPFPNDGGMIFDEVHYVKATTAILQGIPANGEHPPLTKLLIGFSIKLFGNHWFAWRLPIVITALISTYFVYLIAKKFMSEKYAILASAFLIFDTIFFIHGNIYLLEMPSLMFGLIGVFFLLDHKYIYSGAMLGLRFPCNEKMVFILCASGLYLIIGFLTRPKRGFKAKMLDINKKQVITFFFVLSLVAGGGLWINDLIWKPSSKTIVNTMITNTVVQDPNGTAIRTDIATVTNTAYEYITDPISHVKFMWNYYYGLAPNIETNADNFRPPWSWTTPFGANPFNSAKYLVTVVQMGDKKDYLINYQAQVPIPIWYMTFPILFMGLFYIKKDPFARFSVAWIGATYIPWILSDLQKQNMTFIHYFLFTTPVICMGIPWFWSKALPDPKYTTLRQSAIIMHLAITAIFFFIFFPIGLVRSF